MDQLKVLFQQSLYTDGWITWPKIGKEKSNF